MPTYEVWTHIDTGIRQIIETESEDEALDIAESNIELQGFNEQLEANTEVGESEIIRIIKE